MRSQCLLFWYSSFSAQSDDFGQFSVAVADDINIATYRLDFKNFLQFRLCDMIWVSDLFRKKLQINSRTEAEVYFSRKIGTAS